MWTLREVWLAQAALAPPLPWPKQKREAPGKDNINNILAAMLKEVHTEGLFCLHPLSSPKGTAAVVALVLRRTTALRPPPPRVRPRGTRRLQNKLTQLLCPTELPALKLLYCVTPLSKRLAPGSEGATLLPPAPSGAERQSSLHHLHPCQALPERPWHGPSCC